ncbi:MAG: VWA domain-containing protein [Blastocatellia bacterium]|nr:VWA domain-containing protein [Blastocatellia bacterium]
MCTQSRRLIALSHAVLMVIGLLSVATFSQEQPPAKKKNQPTATPAKENEAPEEEQVLRVGTTQIVLNAIVTDGLEHHVAGLKPEHFNLFEDQAPQTIISFGMEQVPFVAAILLDLSGSMGNKMSLARAACARFADGIRVGDSIGIYSFSKDKVKLMQDFSEVKDIDPIVWDTDPDGETPLYDAIVTASEALGKREEQRRAILLISDGADTKSKATFEKAIRAASLANVMIYAVDMSEAAFGRGPAKDNGSTMLKDFALKTGGRFFPSPGGSQLRDAFVEAVDELRNQYTLVYESTNDKQDGKWRAIQLTAKNPTLKVRTRQGYYATKAEKK